MYLTDKDERAEATVTMDLDSDTDWKSLIETLPEKYREDRHDHDVLGRDKARLCGGCPGDACLLGQSRQKERRPGDRSPRKKRFQLGFVPGLFIFPGVRKKKPVPHHDHGDEERGPDPAPCHEERERPHVLRPHALRDKGRAPDRGRKHEEQQGNNLCLFAAFSCHIP